MKGDFELSKVVSLIIVIAVVLILVFFAMKITTLRSMFLKLLGLE